MSFWEAIKEKRYNVTKKRKKGRIRGKIMRKKQKEKKKKKVRRKYYWYIGRYLDYEQYLFYENTKTIDRKIVFS